MNNGISKAQPRRSRVRLSKCLQEQLLNAIAIPSPAAAGLPQDAQQPEVEGEGAQPADKTPVIQHPKPKPPYAYFLEKFVDPFQPGPRAGSERCFVLEWLESVGRLPHPETVHEISTGDGQHTGCFAVPPMPASTASYSLADAGGGSGTPSNIIASSSGPTGKTLVENPQYRLRNLAMNNIHFPRPPYQEFTEQIASIINKIHKDRDSPGPSLEDVRQDAGLAALPWMGAEEPQVEEYFRTDIFPSLCITEPLKHNIRQPMAKHAVPSTGSNLKVSTPMPDLLYGYNQQNAFPQQQTQLISMGTEMIADNRHESVYYPFFVIEFMGDSGSMWVATNQCLGGSVSCVNIAEKLNRRLRQCESDMVHPINSAAFSIAMNGTEARLYITWKHNELDYHMAYVDGFYLQDPEQFLKFRKYIRNILDWGRGERLEGIRVGLEAAAIQLIGPNLGSIID